MLSNIKLLLYFPLLYQQRKVGRDIYYYSISPINALARPLIFKAGHHAPFFFLKFPGLVRRYYVVSIKAQLMTTNLLHMQRGWGNTSLICSHVLTLVHLSCDLVMRTQQAEAQQKSHHYWSKSRTLMKNATRSNNMDSIRAEPPLILQHKPKHTCITNVYALHVNDQYCLSLTVNLNVI